MAIDFPASPGMGQQYTVGGVTWTWDGTKWVASGTGTGVYLPLTGGTMTGALTLAANPAAPLQPATKQYVDVLPVAMNDNRLVNGDMRIDQRNNGGSFVGQNTYLSDRWFTGAPVGSNLITWQRAAGGPPLLVLGFGYYLGAISRSAYTAAAGDNINLQQSIEADQIVDFAFGTASAQPVTLSFLVWSSVIGTFSGSLCNYAGTRSYPFTYSIPVASTWTKIVITIPGDTAGTWVLQGNAGSLTVRFDLGSGATFRGPANAWTGANYVGVTGAQSIVATNAAAWNVTGVKLETGSVATPYNRQSLAKSMADCERYFRWLPFNMQFQAASAGVVDTTALAFSAMRASPTISTIAVDPNLSQQAANNAVNNFQQITPYTAMSFLQATAAGQTTVIGYRSSASAEL